MSADDRTPEEAQEHVRDARTPGAPDIMASPTKARFPLSRGAPERKLRRVDFYDRRAEVTKYEDLTPTQTVRISFRVVDNGAFSFVPGQFIGIQADVPGYGWRRTPYCIVSPPNGERTFQLLIRLVPQGPLSYYLGRLRPGDVIAFRGPLGRCMVPKTSDEELILLATGVGIGPFLSLAYVLRDQGYEKPVRLYWGLRLAEDICLLDQLEELEATFPRFSYDITLSQPPPGWTGLRGRITETVPPLLPTLGGKRYYLVGNGAMIEEMTLALSDLGVDRTSIYQEPFFNARHKPDPQSLTETRGRFVAHDLFSPGAEDYGLLRPERPLTGSRRVTAPPPR
ncbi:MAG TPA: FAD-binding oxidoreductase [Acidimicrobiales bacterium]|nr:FAD-binding oxidoreductase [Acidimicrobiales bacterium]